MCPGRVLELDTNLPYILGVDNSTYYVPVVPAVTFYNSSHKKSIYTTVYFIYIRHNNWLVSQLRYISLLSKTVLRLSDYLAFAWIQVK